MQKNDFIDAFNKEIQAFAGQIEFKTATFGGYNKEDVHAKIKSIIIKARDLGWAQLGDEATIVETAAAQVEANNAADEAHALLREARLERDRIIEQARLVADEEMLRGRAQMSSEREEFHADFGVKREEMQQGFATEKEDLERQLDTMKNEVRQLTEVKTAVSQQIETGKSGLEQLVNTLLQLQSQIAPTPEQTEVIQKIHE